ncbi:MAG: metallophosphoesterase [Pyrobaculum sp.]
MIVISDVHIGSRHSRVQDLRKCLKTLEPDVVVIAGDLFDDQFRKVSVDEATRLFKKAIEILSIKPRELYISLSSSSHDPQLPGPFSAKIENIEVVAYNGPLVIENKVKAVVTHGDQIVQSGVLAYFIDLVNRGRVGRLIKKRLGLGRDTWLIYGHSHVPYVDSVWRILNPGSWKIYGFRRLRGGVFTLPPAEPLCEPDL